MTTDFVKRASEVVQGMAALHVAAPDAIKGFNALGAAATKTQSLDTRTKELMALAIGIAMRCDGCIAFHTKMARRAEATREQVVETIALAIYMGGGPAAVFGGEALRAFDQFEQAASGG